MSTSIVTSLRERAAARTRIVQEGRVFDTTRPRTPSFLKLQRAVGPGGVLPARMRPMLEACLRHDPRSRSDHLT